MRFWDNHTIDGLSVGWRLSYDPILCRARTKTVSSHDDGVIHGLHAVSPSPSGTTRRTTTDRAKQPSPPETHSILSEFARSSFIFFEITAVVFLSIFSSVLMHVWC